MNFPKTPKHSPDDKRPPDLPSRFSMAPASEVGGNEFDRAANWYGKSEPPEPRGGYSALGSLLRRLPGL